MSDCDVPDASRPPVLMHLTTMMMHSLPSHLPQPVCLSVVLGMISVSIRRARRGKRMMKVRKLFWIESQLLDEQFQEDEVSQADTVSTVMETSSYTGLPDSVYSNYIRKVKHREIGILHWMFSELAVLRRVDRVGQRLLPHLLGDHQRDGPLRLGLTGSGSKLLVNCN